MNFTVYKSSAGSGKTYTLVKEFLKLALSSSYTEKYRHILAITFTNKAAAEMKQRVIDALSELSKEESTGSTVSFLLADLCNDLNTDAGLIRKKSFLILESMLHNYADIGISTIDKFTHRIVRTFAWDLKLPLGFDIEMDGKKLLIEAISELVSKAGEDEKLSRALVDFAESNIDDEKNWNFENELLAFASTLLKEDGIQHLLKLEKNSIEDFFEIRDQLYKHQNIFEKKIRIIGEKGRKVITENNIDPKNFAGGEKTGIHKYFTYLNDFRFDNLNPTPTLSGYMEEDKWHSGKCPPDQKTSIDSIKNLLQDSYFEATTLVGTDYKKQQLFQLVSSNIYPLLLINEIRKILEARKVLNNIVHISEFNKKIAAVIEKEPAPFIYERIGERYSHYLVDEFQDTSVLQWQNLLPLIDHSLSSGNFNMLVGDGKQSIYRWRGGEVEQFSSLPEVFSDAKNDLMQERENSLKRNYKEEKLDTNYRSSAEIINFNNNFFRFLSGQLEENYKNIYDFLEQKSNPKNAGGYVQLDFLKKSEDENEEELYCFKTLECINSSLEDGFELKDIAILCRTNNEASLLASFLVENNINVISSESLLLGLSEKISFIVNVMRYVYESSAKNIHIKIADYLLKNELIKCKQDTHEIYCGILNSTKNIDHLLKENGFELNVFTMQKKSLYELSEEIISIFKLNAVPDPYIQFFLDAVQEFIIKNGNDIAVFTEWWEEKKMKKSVVIPDGINAVRVMTIHKSKGLEFPVVIFPFANWIKKNSTEHLWINFDHEEIPLLNAALIKLNKSVENTDHSIKYSREKSKSLLDQVNVLYVALTRPVSRLHIITTLPGKMKTFSQNYINYLQQCGNWDEGTLSYCFGSKEKMIKKEESTNDNFMNVTSSIYDNWRNKTTFSLQAPLVWDAENTTGQVAYGNLLHTALSKINCFEDCETTLNELEFSGLVSSEEKNLLQNKLNELFQNEAIKCFFKKGAVIKNECEILLPNGITYRPDRIIFEADKSIIIDFKTGKESEKHHEQLTNYGLALHDLGYSNIEKYLIYTETLKVVSVW